MKGRNRGKMSYSKSEFIEFCLAKAMFNVIFFLL